MKDYRKLDREFHEWPSVNVRVKRNWMAKTYEAEVSFGTMGALPMARVESFYSALGKAIKYAKRLNAQFSKQPTTPEEGNGL